MVVALVLIAIVVHNACLADSGFLARRWLWRDGPKWCQGDTLTFSKVNVNEGDAYDPHTGRFTCPVSGLYTFSVHLTRGHEDTLHSEFLLMVDDSPIQTLFIPASNNKYMSGSVTVTTECNQGQHVYVRMLSGRLGQYDPCVVPGDAGTF